MQTIRLNNPNSETLELILSQIKEIENLDLKVKSISLEDIEDLNKNKGSKWTWEIESEKDLNSDIVMVLMEILDPEYDGDFSFEHEGKIYKLILELY